MQKRVENLDIPIVDIVSSRFHQMRVTALRLCLALSDVYLSGRVHRGQEQVAILLDFADVCCVPATLSALNRRNTSLPLIR